MLVTLALIGCSQRPPETSALRFVGDRPVNVLMISIDTLRRDQLGRYGGPQRPLLDRLLSEGVALDDHRSCSSWTYPSATCALTGDDQLSAGFMPQRLEDTRMPSIPQDAVTLAEYLSGAGWSTALSSGNSFIGDTYGLERGYEQRYVEALVPANQIIDQGLALLDRARLDPRPWLLHLHFMDPHMPYEPPPEYLEGLPESEFSLVRSADFEALYERWDTLDEAARARAMADAMGRYQGEVAYLDDQLAGLFEALETRGALDDTLVVLWSDHGEQFFERGLYAHGNGIPYEENATIAGFWAAGLEPAAFAGPTTHQDLLPTVLSALSLRGAEGVQGRAIGAAPPWRCADSYDQIVERTQQSVEADGWRLIYTWDGRLELYDHATDPSEQRDLYAPGHPELERLWPLLEPRVQRASALIAAPSPVPPAL